MASHNQMHRLLNYPIGIGLLILIFVLTPAAYALPSGVHQRREGGPGNPEVKTTVSIGLTGETTVEEFYCANLKKKWPKHPQASGKIQLVLPNNEPPLIAGDGAIRIIGRRRCLNAKHSSEDCNQTNRDFSPLLKTAHDDTCAY